MGPGRVTGQDGTGEGPDMMGLDGTGRGDGHMTTISTLTRPRQRSRKAEVKENGHPRKGRQCVYDSCGDIEIFRSVNNSNASAPETHLCPRMVTYI